MRPAFTLVLFAAFVLQVGCAAHDAARREAYSAAPGLIRVNDAQRDPQYWISRHRDADVLRLDAATIATRNRHMLERDPSLHDLAALPATLPGTELEQAIRTLSTWPSRPLFDDTGAPLPDATRDALLDALALDTLPAQVAPRFALVTRRADLRTFPTAQRVFAAPGDIDIDRFQESALFPGTAVAILHASRDGVWSFVASTTYRAWIASDAIARGDRDIVLGYAQRQPSIVVTGATARTVFTRVLPAVSALQLDMGVRLPLHSDLPPDAPVNGQHPAAAHVVELPLRGDDGMLRLAPALIPETADVATDALPFTDANVLRQAFKFLGEPYGWGHADGARDCSGFVSEIYRSVGLLLPRNTGDQARSPALAGTLFDADADPAARRDALRDLRTGDLVYIPGHVMLVLGRDGDRTFVIHDVAGVHLRDAGGDVVRVPINGVAVTPLEPLLAADGRPLVELVTSIRRPGAASIADPTLP